MPWASPLPPQTRVWYINQYDSGAQTGMFRCVPASATVFNCAPVTWTGADAPPVDGNEGLVLVGDTAYVGTDNTGTNKLYTCPVAGGACGPPTTWSNWKQQFGGYTSQGGMMLAPGSTTKVVIVSGPLSGDTSTTLATCPIAPGATVACNFQTLTGLPTGYLAEWVSDAGGGNVFIGLYTPSAPPAPYNIYECSLSTSACALATTWTNFPVYNANPALTDYVYNAYSDPTYDANIYATILNGPNLQVCPSSGTGACTTITLVNGPRFDPSSSFGPSGIFSRYE